MRKIKFRGKTWKGKWVYGLPVILIQENYDDDIIDGIRTWWDGNEDVNPETVGQWTGKKDSKGIEIYDGDIIEFDEKEWGSNDNIHTVTWDDHNAEWCWGGGTTSDMEYRTVVGNIHDQTPNHDE